MHYTGCGLHLVQQLDGSSIYSTSPWRCATTTSPDLLSSAIAESDNDIFQVTLPVILTSSCARALYIVALLGSVGHKSVLQTELRVRLHFQRLTQYQAFLHGKVRDLLCQVARISSADESTSDLRASAISALAPATGNNRSSRPTR